MVVISAKDISKAYGTDIITEDVCFGVEKGDRIGIVGANGCGKSTLMGIIAGENEPTSGELYIRRDMSLAYLKQNNNFLGNGTVIEEASKSFSHMYAMEERIKELEILISDHKSESFEKDLAEYTELMEEFEQKGGYTYKSELAATLKAMGFSEEDLDKTTDKLSGGERTRLALSCILLKKPDILMLDEPTAGLDPAAHKDIIDMIKKVQREMNLLIIFVSHNMSDIADLSDRVFVMKDGRIVMDGSPEDVFSRGDELREMGLSVPPAKEIAGRIKERAPEFESKALSIEGLAEDIQKFRNIKGKA